MAEIKNLSGKLSLLSSNNDNNSISIISTTGGIDIQSLGLLSMQSNTNILIGTTVEGIPITIGTDTGSVIIKGSITLDAGISNINVDVVSGIENAGTIDFNGNNDILLTHTGDAVGKDFILSEAGTSGKLLISSYGDHNDAISVKTYGGGILIDTGLTGEININAGALGLSLTSDDNITIDASNQLNITSGSTASITASTGDLILTTDVDQIVLNAKTGFDLQYDGVSQAEATSDGTLTLKPDANYTITHNGDLNEDLTIKQTGNGSLVLSSENGLNIGSTGTLDIVSGTTASITTSTGDLILTSDASQIVLNAKTGFDLQYDGVSQAEATSEGTLTLKPDANYTITHNGDLNEDLTIKQTGNGSLVLSSENGLNIGSTGTLDIVSGTTASITTLTGDLILTSDASQIVLNAKTGFDLQYDSVSQVEATADGTLTLKPNSSYIITHQGIDIGQDLEIQQTGLTGKLILSSESNMDIQTTNILDISTGITGFITLSTGGLTMLSLTEQIILDAKTGINLKYDGISQVEATSDGTLTLKPDANYTITHNGDLNEDLTIQQTGNGSLILSSANALNIDSTGSLDIVSGTTASITTSTGDLILTSDASQIVLNAKTGFDLQFDGVSQAEATANGTLTLKPNSSYIITHNGITGENLTIQQLGVGGNININSENQINLQSDSDVNITSSSNTIIKHDTGTTIYSEATFGNGILTLRANENYIIRHPANGNNDDLTIEQLNNFNSSILIKSEGNGTDSIKLSTITNNGSIMIDTDNNLDLLRKGQSQAKFTTDGVLDIRTGAQYSINHLSDANNQDLVIDQLGTHDSSLLLRSAGTANDAIELRTTNATGGVKINGRAGVDIQFNSSSQAKFSSNGTLTLKPNSLYTITHNGSGDGQDLKIQQTGTTGKLILSSTAGMAIGVTGELNILSTANMGLTGNNVLLNATNDLSLVSVANTSVSAVDFTVNSTTLNLETTGNMGLTGDNILLNATSDLSLVSDANTSVSAVDFTVNSTTLNIETTGNMGLTGDNILFNATSDLSLVSVANTSVSAVDFSVNSTTLNIETTGNMGLTGVDVLLYATSDLSLVSDVNTSVSAVDFTINSTTLNIETTGNIGITGDNILLNATNNGNISFVGGIVAATEGITSSSAISLTTLITTFDTTDGGITGTLSNGTNGQMKILIAESITGANLVTIEPTSLIGYSNIILPTTGSSATLVYISSGWVVVNEIGATLTL